MLRINMQQLAHGKPWASPQQGRWNIPDLPRVLGNAESWLDINNA